MKRCYKVVMLLILMIFIVSNITLAYDINNLKLSNSFNAQTKNIKTTDSKIHNFMMKELNNDSFSLMNYSVKQKNICKQKEQDNIEDTNQKQVINLTDEQLNLLSKLIAAEARGESYEGQVAVAAVVLNRVQDERFPDSIEGVIYQKNAFSVVKNGYIYENATEESYKAAKDALYGNDPTNNAIYFWNPDISTCNWMNTLDPHLRIGNHVFAR